MYTAIGRRIRRARKQQNLTQEQFAEMVGISLSFLGHIERGTRKLSVDTLCKIAKVLHCSADELLGTEPNINSHTLADDLGEIINELQAIKNRFI